MATDRLTLGVAARLSRYLQVLTQAKKMGKSSISSQAISEYTNVNPTQIRRDLSGFGKFGKRGVGYDIDSLIEQIRKILRTSGQHNIALFGAGNLGQAIATSGVFADTASASRRSSTSTRSAWACAWATSRCATTTSSRPS
jgi:redox-sensing transcriptional repressor